MPRKSKNSVDKNYGEKYAGRQMFHDTTAKLEQIAKAMRIPAQLQRSVAGYEVDDPLAVIQFWHGADFDDVWNDYEQGITTDREVIDQMLLLFNQFADAHNLPRCVQSVA